MSEFVFNTKFNANLMHRKYIQGQLYSKWRNFYQFQAITVKLGENDNERRGNLTIQRDSKSGERHTVIIPETF